MGRVAVRNSEVVPSQFLSFMPPPGQTGRQRHYFLTLSIRVSVRLSVRPSVCYQTCEHDHNHNNHKFNQLTQRVTSGLQL